MKEGRLTTKGIRNHIRLMALTTLLGPFLSHSFVLARSEVKKPNVSIIYADDLGHGRLGAAFDRVCESLFGVGPGGNEFVGHEALIAGLTNRLHDGGIVKLLRFIEFVAARATGGVVVRVV